jgi:hypothetical protein
MIASLMEENISMKAEVESRLWIIVHRKESRKHACIETFPRWPTTVLSMISQSKVIEESFKKFEERYRVFLIWRCFSFPKPKSMVW